MYKKTALLQTGINKYQSSQLINRDRLNLALHIENTGPRIFVTENRRRIKCRRRTAEFSERFLHPVNDTLARGETFPNMLKTMLLATRMATFPRRRGRPSCWKLQRFLKDLSVCRDGPNMPPKPHQFKLMFLN